MDRLKAINKAQRIVVKVGTGLLTNAERQLDLARVAALADQIATLRRNSIEVAVVSSGAIGAGMAELGMSARPTELPELQACAAIGQSKLMSLYAEAFGRHKLHVAQILLTHDDLSDRVRHLNARNTMDTLLARGIVPIINENDTVSVDEIRFGDNDRLAALTAALLPADLLIILTTAQGLMTKRDGTGERIPFVERLDDSLMKLAGGAANAQSVGGMISKLQSAKIVHAAGIPLVIANGRAAGVLADILAGKDIGTFFAASAKKMVSRKTVDRVLSPARRPPRRGCRRETGVADARLQSARAGRRGGWRRVCRRRGRLAPRRGRHRIRPRRDAFLGGRGPEDLPRHDRRDRRRARPQSQTRSCSSRRLGVTVILP